MQQEPRKHHFDPQWYLRRFGNKDKYRIAVYDKWTHTLSIERPMEVAFEVGLYDIDHADIPRWACEKVLSNVENHAAPAVVKATTHGLGVLSADEREAIAAFVATQLARVPSHRPAVLRQIERTMAYGRSRLSDAEVREMAGRDLTGREIELIRGPALRPFEPRGAMAWGVGYALNRWVDELLTDYRWSLLVFDPAELITSDTPVRPMSERGSDGSLSVFADIPLGPGHALVLQSGEGGTITAGLGGPDDWFRDSEGLPSLPEFQKLSVFRAERWLFGHPDNPLWEEIGVSAGTGLSHRPERRGPPKAILR